MWAGCAGRRRRALGTALLCAVWYSLSAGSNVVGALVLARAPLPLTLALLQLLAAAALTPPALAACGAARGAPPPALHWRALLPLAAAKLLTTVFSQISIWKVPVSYAHTVKATTPLWTALLAFALFGERQSRGVVGALALIAGGVALASATELRFEPVGLGAALAAAALLSLQHLYSKRVLRAARDQHPLRLLARLSALALGPAAALAAWYEGRRWAEAAAEADARLVLLVAGDAGLAWLQALAAFGVLARVSPLAYGVASAAKRAAVVAASLLLLGNPAPPANLAGMALAATGVLLYNRAKAGAPAAAAAAADRAPLLPV